MTSAIGASGPGGLVGAVAGVEDVAAAEVLGGGVVDGPARAGTVRPWCASRRPAPATRRSARPPCAWLQRYRAALTSRLRRARRRVPPGSVVTDSLPSANDRTQPSREHHERHGRGFRSRRRAPMAIRSIRAPAGWPAAAARPAAARAVARCAVLPRLRVLRPAAPQVHARRRQQVPADERGLPHPERGGAVGADRRANAGDVLHSRRRIHAGQLRDSYLRRRRTCPPRVRLRLGELPARRAGLPGHVVAVHPRAPHRWEPVPARPGPRIAVGAREHRGVRRRPRQGHDLRRERRRSRRRDLAGRARRARIVCRRDRRKPSQRDGSSGRRGGPVRRAVR